MPEIDLGYNICDMHGFTYSIGDRIPVLGGTMYVKSHIKTRVPNVHEFIEKCIDGYYINKMLVVIGEQINGNIVATYSYDAIWFGLMELALEKKEKDKQDVN